MENYPNALDYCGELTGYRSGAQLLPAKKQYTRALLYLTG